MTAPYPEAHPLVVQFDVGRIRSATRAATSAYRTPCAVSACRTRHEPTEGLRRLRLGPCRGFSPGGRDISGPPRCSGGTRRPLRGVVRGRAADGQCPVAEPRVVVADECPIDRETLLDGGFRTPLGHANAGRFVGHLLPHRGQVIRAVAILEMGQQLRPCAPQLPPPPEQIPCGAPGGRRPIRLWEHPATAQDRNFLCVDLVVVRCATWDRFHSARVPEDHRHPCARTEVGQPRPGEEAFDADDESGPLGCHGVEKRFWASRPSPVDKHLALLVQDAEVHGAGMQIDATVQLGLCRRESHGDLLLS